MSIETSFNDLDDAYEEYKRQALKENEAEVRGDDPVRQRCRLVSFTSHSAGRGRKRRARGVELLIVDETYAYVIKNHEVRPRKNNDYIKIDVLANEILGHLPPEERTVDKLIEAASG